MKCDDENLPSVEAVFRSNSNNSEFHRLYTDVVKKTIKKILPSDFFDNTKEKKETSEYLAYFDEALPLVTCGEFSEPPFAIPFYLVCPSRHHPFKFFFEMMSRWLLPGKHLEVQLFFSADFCFVDQRDKCFTICELVLAVESKEDLKLMKENLPLFETEICLGVASMHRARRILDIKGFSSDEKTAMIQEIVLTLVKHRSKYFNYDLLTEMQHFLVVARDSFKLIREARLMSRIICTHYTFRKQLLQSIEQAPERRHISLKCIRARLHLEKGVKIVLGLILGINFLRDHELLEERHLVKAINNYVSNVVPVDNSFFSKGIFFAFPSCFLKIRICS